MLKKLHFKNRLLILSLLFISLTVILFSVITYHYGKIASEDIIGEKLTNAQSIQQEFLKQKAKQLELVSLLVSSEPAFITYVAEAINYYKKENQTEFLTSIADLLQERKQQYTFDFAILTDETGLQMARSDEIISVVKDLSSNNLLAQSMQKLQPINGFWFENKQLYQSAVVPIAQGQNLVGFLITGNKIDNNYLNKISQLSGTEVLIILNNNQYSVLATSADVGLSQSFENSINNEEFSFEKNFNNQYANIKINRNHYVLNTQVLAQVTDRTKSYLITAVSRDKILAPFINTRLTLLISAFILAVFAIISTMMLLKPFFSELNFLSTKVLSIKKNSHSKIVKITQPELYAFANNINQLGSDISGKSSLAKHIVEVSKKIPTVNDYFWIESENEVIKPNQTIGKRFKILRKIGSGGMGMVFQAIDIELNELIALKVLKKTQNESLQISQLKDEIKFSRRIQNPNVVRIHDFGKIGGHVFISMEYIMGYTIAEVLNFAQKLRPEAAKYTAMQICKGLAAAHNEGIIHRDLKPENLIIELDNTVKLMDFGIASAQSHVSKTQQTEMIEGTVAYSSPEQLQGKGADERSDIYALGTIIMEMFCGHRPFTAENDDELMYKKVSEQPAHITDFWASAPVLLEEIISKCLHINPDQRYQKVSEVLADLRNIHL